MKLYVSAILTALSLAPMMSMSALAMPEPQMEQEPQTYTDAELDSLLAPIALYPDSVLTHILIASTYPLEVIAADRWRQDNLSLTTEQVEVAVDSFDWDPSVKALAPFAEILQTMSQDLDWLQAVGDNVLISQQRVLGRVQVLRQHAEASGSLTDNDYIRVERDADVIVIEPASPRVVYVPYYDTRVVYGPWWHPIAPRYWGYPAHYHSHGGFYWGPSIHISSFFYFGGIHWHDRYVAVTHRPVRRYYSGPTVKRVYSQDFQRWDHDVKHRRTRYSTAVVHSRPAASRPVVVQSHGKVDYRASKPRVGDTVTRSSTKVIERQPNREPARYDNRQVTRGAPAPASVSRNHTQQVVKAERERVSSGMTSRPTSQQPSKVPSSVSRERNPVVVAPTRSQSYTRSTTKIETQTTRSVTTSQQNAQQATKVYTSPAREASRPVQNVSRSVNQPAKPSVNRSANRQVERGSVKRSEHR